MNWLEEALAEQLHKEFRATTKSMRRNFSWVHTRDPQFIGVPNHDHGWKGCHRKEYFRRRARRWMASWPYSPEINYWPNDLTSPFALCLRHDHAHTVEAGCWIPAPKETRIREAHPTVVMKDPIFESPEENT